MLKGVHKRVIEVKGSSDVFFEKAILFMRSDCSEESSRQLSLAAEEYLKAAIFSKTNRRQTFKKIVLSLCLFAAGAFFAWGISLLA